MVATSFSLATDHVFSPSTPKRTFTSYPESKRDKPEDYQTLAPKSKTKFNSNKRPNTPPIGEWGGTKRELSPLLNRFAREFNKRPFVSLEERLEQSSPPLDVFSSGSESDSENEDVKSYSDVSEESDFGEGRGKENKTTNQFEEIIPQTASSLDADFGNNKAYYLSLKDLATLTFSAKKRKAEKDKDRSKNYRARKEKKK